MATKNEVLAVLEANRERYISGQELADTLGLSRTAVWKAMEGLREEGHRIGALKNKGYRLEAESDRLSEEGIRAALNEAYQALPLLVLEQTDSTNTQAKKLAADGAAHGTLIVAEEQTAGRGRGGKNFFSPYGAGLYMSLILKPGTGIREPQRLTLAAALATLKAIVLLTDTKPQVKWVNDLYLDGKKICGILTEAVTDVETGGIDSIIVGVGVDCNMEERMLPPELQGIVGSLNSERLNRNRMAAEIARGMLDWLPQLNSPDLIEEYRKHSMMTGREVSFLHEGAEHHGVVTGIGDGGELLVRLMGGESLALASGAVSLGNMTECGGELK